MPRPCRPVKSGRRKAGSLRKPDEANYADFPGLDRTPVQFGIDRNPGDLNVSDFWNHFVSDGGTSFDQPPALPEADETAALDAFSQVVVRVADALRPAVVNLRVGRGQRAGSGSGVL